MADVSRNRYDGWFAVVRRISQLGNRMVSQVVRPEPFQPRPLRQPPPCSPPAPRLRVEPGHTACLTRGSAYGSQVETLRYPGSDEQPLHSPHRCLVQWKNSNPEPVLSHPHRERASRSMSPSRTFRSSTPPAVVFAVMRATRNATFDSRRLLATVNSFSSRSGVRARPMFFGSGNRLYSSANRAQSLNFFSTRRRTPNSMFIVRLKLPKGAGYHCKFTRIALCVLWGGVP